MGQRIKVKVSIQPTPPNLLSASKDAVLESQAQALREKVGSLEEPVAESGNNDGVMRLSERGWERPAWMVVPGPGCILPLPGCTEVFTATHPHLSTPSQG